MARPEEGLSWRKRAAEAFAAPGGSVLVLRAFLGVTFAYAGLDKLANHGFFNARSPGSIQSQLVGSIHTTPFGSLLTPLLHVAVPLGIVIAFAELAVGLGTLLGLYARIAAVGGVLLALMFFLTVSFNDSPYFYGADIVFVFAWTPLAIGGAGPWSLDAYFERLRGRLATGIPAGAVGGGPSPRGEAALDRRTAVRKLAAAGLVGSFGVVVAGLAAAIGRMFAKGTTTNTASLGGSGGSGGSGAGGSGSGRSGSGSGGGSGAGGGGSASGVRGRLLGKASEVPVGGAASFVDPFQNDAPGYVVQPKEGEFVAFSAICTHQGCTVQYARSVQQFQCPCHGSVYSALTGQVLRGPAPLPLPKIPIEERGGDIYVER